MKPSTIYTYSALDNYLNLLEHLRKEVKNVNNRRIEITNGINKHWSKWYNRKAHTEQTERKIQTAVVITDTFRISILLLSKGIAYPIATKLEHARSKLFIYLVLLPGSSWKTKKVNHITPRAEETMPKSFQHRRIRQLTWIPNYNRTQL